MADDPVWTPDPQVDTRMAQFHRFAEGRLGLEVDDLHAWSVADPGTFWSTVWDDVGIVGVKGERAWVPTDLPEAVFFPEARINLAENLLARLPDPAVIVTGEAGDGVAVVARVGPDDLRDQVAATAGAMRARGVGVGDRVVLVLPVGVPALVVTLAALSIGAVVASASPDFGSAAILDRFGQLDPVLLVGTTGYRWNGRRHDRTDDVVAVIRGLPSLRSALIVPVADDVASAVDPDTTDVVRLAALAVAGTGHPVRIDLLAEAQRQHMGADLAFERLPFDHPAYVLFTSGTTGKPKCLLHRAGGLLIKQLTEIEYHADVRPGDRLMFATTTGWMLWNWAITVLAAGATLVLHDGAPTYPGPAALFDVAELAGVTHLGMGARLLDGMRAAEASASHGRDLSALRVLLVTASPFTEATSRWVTADLGPSVFPQAISGGTDLLGSFLGADPRRPVWAGELQGPVLGMDVDVVDDDGASLGPGFPGELVCRTTFPSVPLGIWGDADGSRLRATYFERFPGLWTHGDRTSRTEHGGFVIHGRSDATLNVGGVRIGTGEIYGPVQGIEEVVEALVFAQEWDGDTRMVLLVVLQPGLALGDALQEQIRATLRSAASPRHVPAVIAEVAELPRTLTGKVAEIAVAEAVAGRPVRNRDALANPEALDAIVAHPALH